MDSTILLEVPGGQRPDESEELLLPEPDDQRPERTMGARASLVATRIIQLLGAAADDNRTGFVLAADCGYKIFPHAPQLIRYPDITFVRRGRLPTDEIPDGVLSVV